MDQVPIEDLPHIVVDELEAAMRRGGNTDA